MADKTVPQRTRRKLTRRQIQEILERNCKLYKDEESFIPYVIELALYLLEYEYDWTDSGAEPPARVASHEDDRELRAIAGIPGPVKAYRDANATTTSLPGHDTCALCGAALNGAMLCPNCRSLTG